MSLGTHNYLTPPLFFLFYKPWGITYFRRKQWRLNEDVCNNLSCSCTVSETVGSYHNFWRGSIKWNYETASQGMLMSRKAVGILDFRKHKFHHDIFVVLWHYFFYLDFFFISSWITLNQSKIFCKLTSVFNKTKKRTNFNKVGFSKYNLPSHMLFL